MAGYRVLLRTPGVGRIIAAQLTARFPNGMISLAVLLHIEHVTGSYGAAGLVLAATSVGQAVADAAVLLAGGEPGQRSMLAHARVVLRQPHAEGARGTIPDLIVAADEIVRQRREVEAMLAADTGRSPEQIHADLDRDLVLDAEAAKAFGLVDQIV